MVWCHGYNTHTNELAAKVREVETSVPGVYYLSRLPKSTT